MRDIKGITTTSVGLYTMGEGKDEIMLFGVRVVVVDSLRKTVSLNNLSQYDHLNNSNNNNNDKKEDASGVGGGAADGGCVSADESVPHRSRSERKRGVAWTEEEHKLFLMGLKKVGKGDWRSISRNFVKTRTPTQVASHAQKYFLRRTNLNRHRRRRSSLFDITTDQVSEIPLEEQQAPNQEKNITVPHSHVLPPSQPETTNGANLSMLPAFAAAFSSAKISVPAESKEAGNPSANTIRPIPVIPPPCTSPVCDLNLDLNLSPTFDASPLSLKLSLASDQREISSRHSAFQVMQSYKNGDGIISVA